MNKELDGIIDYIINGKSYKKCIELKNKMDCNEEIKNIIDRIKILQKKYVKSNYMDSSIKKELDELEEVLNNYPIYVEYNNYLNDVNEMINYVKDELNDYFYKLLNENNQ